MNGKLIFNNTEDHADFLSQFDLDMSIKFRMDWIRPPKDNYENIKREQTKNRVQYMLDSFIGDKENQKKLLRLVLSQNIK